MDYRIFVPENENLHIADGIQKSLNGQVRGPFGLLFGYSEKFGGIVSEPCSREIAQAFVDAGGYRVIDATSGAAQPFRPTEPPKTLEEMAQATLAEMKALQRAKQSVAPSKEQALAEFAAKYQGAADKTTLPGDELRRALHFLGVKYDPTASQEELLELYAQHSDPPQAPEGGDTEEQEFLRSVYERWQADPQRLSRAELRRALALLGANAPVTLSTAAALELYSSLVQQK